MKIKFFIFLSFLFIKAPVEANPWMVPLEAASGIMGIAEFIGLVEGVERKVDKLIEAELETAMDLLDQAEKSSGEKENLIRDARLRFTKAANLESGLRKATALYGLAVCHSYFKDYENRNEALNEILEIEPISRFSVEMYRAKKLGVDAAVQAFAPTPVMPVVAITNSILEIVMTDSTMEIRKEKIKSLFKSNLTDVDKTRIFLLYFNNKNYKEERELHDMQKDIYNFLKKNGVRFKENSSLKAYHEVKNFLQE